LLYDEPDWKPLPSNEQITNMVAHNGNVQEPRTNPWIITEGAQIYEMQSQNEDQFIPVTIGEMGALKSANTGKAACVNDVYLYFSLGEEKLERWFNNSLEDVGPDLGSGLPSARKGRIAALLSYPGRVYEAISHPDNTASIMMLSGSSQHEVYRAPSTSLEISHLYSQNIPGDIVSRLWFDQGGEIVRLHTTASNPNEASSYEFVPYGHLDTGWIYAGMKDIVKIWKSLTLFTETTSVTTKLLCDYKTDDDTTWTQITNEFNTHPTQEEDFATTLPNNKRIKIRLIPIAVDKDTPGITRAMLVKAFGIIDIKYVYRFPVVVADQWQEVDLQGDKQMALGYTAAASTAITKLRSWANAGTPLTLHSNVAAMDDTTVIMQGPPLRPVRIDNVGQAEKYLLNVVLRDV